MKDVKDSNRMVYLDLLRILAAFSVVLLHSAAQFWYVLDIKSTDWVIANSYDAISRFGVPLFVMISGVLFLDPKRTIDWRRLYKHNILRLVIIYIVWSAAYGLLDCIWMWDTRMLHWKDVLREMLSGRYHLWFLPMLAGIYVLLPLLKSWLEYAKKSEIQYFLILFMVLQIGTETLRALTVSDEIHYILSLTKVDLICSYVGYFVWGYYLAYVGIGTGLRKFFCWSAIPACLLNIILGCALSWREGRPMAGIYDSYSLFTFIISTALFLLFLNSKKEYSGKTQKRIREISAGTLGVYLVHIGVMEVSKEYGLHCMMIPNIIGIPLHAIVCFVVCLLISMLLRRIPSVGRYLC